MTQGRGSDKATLLRALMQEANIRPRDLVKRWGIQSPSVTGILNGRSRSHLREHDLANLLSKTLHRKITWEDVFDPPQYVRSRALLPDPQEIGDPMLTGDSSFYRED